jgi:dienelactone hydrolase
MFYVRHGFVLFVPHRRGHGLSGEAGPYIGYTPATSPALSDALVAQSDDVMAAVAFVASRPEVDRKRVAVAGCSFGGIEALLAAERGTGIVAAVDFAGAAITWAGNEALRERMRSAARGARVPVLFLQAENDYDTTPSRVLSEEMKAAGKPYGVHIFPPNASRTSSAAPATITLRMQAFAVRMSPPRRVCETSPSRTRARTRARLPEVSRLGASSAMAQRGTSLTASERPAPQPGKNGRRPRAMHEVHR